MSENLFAIIRLIIEVAKYILVYWGICKFSLKRKKSAYIIASLVLMLSIGMLYFGDSQYYNIVVKWIVCFTVIKIIFDSSLKNVLLSFFLVHGIIAIYDSLAVSIIILLFGLKLEYFVGLTIFYILQAVLLLILLAFIIILLKNKIKGLQEYVEKVTVIQYIFTIVGVTLAMAVAGGVQGILIQKYTERYTELLVFYGAGICLIIFILAVVLTYISSSRHHYKEIAHLNAKYITMQEEHYISLMRKQEDMRKFRHDYKQHLFCIEGLLQCQQYKEAEQYITELIGVKNDLTSKIETGNVMLDVIINEILEREKSHNIKLLCEGRLPDTFSMSLVDMCKIFANAINNAVEACIKLPEEDRVIELYIRVFKNRYYFDIENPAAEPMMLKKGRPQTSKREKKQHGLGTQNMLAAVKNYEGTVTWENRPDNRVHVAIELIILN